MLNQAPLALTSKPTIPVTHLLLTAAFFAVISASAHADVLASYGFTSGSASVTNKDPNVTAGSFSFAQGTNTNRVFSSGGNIFARVNATGASDLATAISGNEYVTVTITPNPGYSLNLTSLTVDLGYSLDGVAVPTGIGVALGTSVFSSVNGFTAPAVLATQTYTAANQSSGILYQNVNIDLSGPEYQGLTSAISFRIYYYDSVTGSTPTQPIHRIDNFVLNGTVGTVPTTPLAVKGIQADASTIQLLLSGTPG